MKKTDAEIQAELTRAVKLVEDAHIDKTSFKTVCAALATLPEWVVVEAPNAVAKAAQTMLALMYDSAMLQWGGEIGDTAAAAQEYVAVMDYCANGVWPLATIPKPAQPLKFASWLHRRFRNPDAAEATDTAKAVSVCPLRTIAQSLIHGTDVPLLRNEAVCYCAHCAMWSPAAERRKLVVLCDDPGAVAEPVRPPHVPADWDWQAYGPIAGTEFICRHAKWLEDKQSLTLRWATRPEGSCFALLLLCGGHENMRRNRPLYEGGKKEGGE